MTKYFDKKMRKNMFFNIFCSFFALNCNKMSLTQILCHFVSPKEDGKVFDNWITTLRSLMSLMTLKICKTI